MPDGVIEHIDPSVHIPLRVAARETPSNVAEITSPHFESASRVGCSLQISWLYLGLYPHCQHLGLLLARYIESTVPHSGQSFIVIHRAFTHGK